MGQDLTSAAVVFTRRWPDYRMHPARSSEGIADRPGNGDPGGSARDGRVRARLAQDSTAPDALAASRQLEVIDVVPRMTAGIPQALISVCQSTHVRRGQN